MIKTASVLFLLLFSCVCSAQNSGCICTIDSDGDGVMDCFDRCSDTPQEVPVTSQGCPKDTDGDGVPDYKDKQLITATECQPSDADGIGECPEPDCCNETRGIICGCFFPTVYVGFSSYSTRLWDTEKIKLNDFAQQMRSNPNKKVVVIGLVNQKTNPKNQQFAWAKVNAIIDFMTNVEKIDKGRFIFKYGQTGNNNLVKIGCPDKLLPAGKASGPSYLKQPFPNQFYFK